MIKPQVVKGMTQNAGEVTAEGGAPLGFNAQGILPHVTKKPSAHIQETMVSRLLLSLIWEKSHTVGSMGASMVATGASTSSYAVVVIVIMTGVFVTR